MSKIVSTYQNTAQDLDLVRSISAKYRDRPDMLMDVITQVQKITSELSEDVVNVISQETRVSVSKIYSFITFYAMLSTNKLGKYVIRMCKSAPCHVLGAKEIMDTVIDFFRYRSRRNN